MFENSVILSALLAPFQHFLEPGDRLSYVFMASALVVATGAYVLHQAGKGQLRAVGLVRWLLPLDVLRHPSCQVDFVYFFVHRALRALIYGSILVSSLVVFDGAMALLTSTFGPPETGIAPRLWISAIVTLVTMLVLDFTLWFMHYIFHVVPFLWDYHKVHHSAEVMTPITGARMHPMEELLDSAVTALVTGTVYALFVYFLGSAAVEIMLIDMNIILCVFFLAAFNLRHSHVWVRYPNWLQHILVSPAQHQIHHSTAHRHWDKNMGFVFAFWDWAAGTLYSPKEREEIVYGLGTEEDGGSWHSLTALYLRPFQQSYGRIARWVQARRSRPEQ